MQVACSFGNIGINDVVEIQHSTGKKVGKVKGIVDTLNGILVDIYYTDKSGGHTITVPHYNIVGISNNVIESKKIIEEIKKPSRYNKRGELECWDVILDQEMNFLEGNILKYVWRYKEKNGVQDLKKARVYLDKLILELENK